MKRHGGKESSESKRRKCVVSWDRDVICLPNDYFPEGSDINATIPYPRGKYRTFLARMKLIGKVHLTSNMTVDEVMNEFRSAFVVPMKKNPSFRFSYLQSTGGGSRSLAVPNVSSSFTWSVQQVAKLGSNRGTIYILALDDLDLAVLNQTSPLNLFIIILIHILIL